MARHLPPHPRRDELLALVKAKPGICAYQVCVVTGWTYNVCSYHAWALRRAGRLVMRRIGYRLCFFPLRPARQDTWRLDVAAHQPGLLALHDLIARRGPLYQARILEEFETRGVPRSTVQHRLQRIVDLGLVSRSNDGRRAVYTALPN